MIRQLKIDLTDPNNMDTKLFLNLFNSLSWDYIRQKIQNPDTAVESTGNLASDARKKKLAQARQRSGTLFGGAQEISRDIVENIVKTVLER